MLGRARSGCRASAATRPASLRVRVVAIQPVPEEAAPGVGAVKAYHDWLVGCDNRLGCTALGLAPEGGSGGYVVLRLDAGAAAQPSLAFVLVDPAGPARRCASRSWASTTSARSRSRPRPTVPGSMRRSPRPSAPALIAATRDGDHLELALGDAEPVTVSLRGATAAMLLIDDRQWRIGKVTALARPGDAPAASVASPPDAPAVAAKPIRALDASPRRGHRGRRRPELRRRRRDRLRPRRRDGALGRLRFAAAYNTAFRFWTAGPDGLAPAVFDVPGGATATRRC